VDDRDYSSTLLLVEDDQNDVESTLAAWSERRPIKGGRVPCSRGDRTTIMKVVGQLFIGGV
jgi:hypothetical protein